MASLLSVSSNNQSSCAGILSILNEQEDALKVAALDQLLRNVDTYWPEIADCIPLLEGLYESASFQHKQLVALLIAKVFYHLGDLDESLRYALEASTLFNFNENDTFCNSIVARAIDIYVKWCQQHYNVSSNTMDFSSASDVILKLSQLMQNLFRNSIENSSFEKCIGLAIDCRSFDTFQQVIDATPSSQKYDILCYAKKIVHKTTLPHLFFTDLIQYLLVTAQALSPVDYFYLFDCLSILQDSQQFAAMISHLFVDKNTKAIAMQICFDLYENSSSDFKNLLLTHLRSQPFDCSILHQIISGSVTNKLYLEFLCRNNHSDLLILEESKNALGTLHSHYISAIAFSNGFMHIGTTFDEFLRKNIEYMKHAVNWAKFNSVACVGMIHRGNVENAFKILQDYLPENYLASSSSSNISPYAEGGALFALGLIHSEQSRNLKIIEYLSSAVQNVKKEPLLHGSCLGLGLAAIGSGDRSIVESLFSVLFSDDAITGEAAAIAIGLVSLGKGCQDSSLSSGDNLKSTVFSTLSSYCLETQHEKIKRGIALAIALLFFNHKEKALSTIDELSRSSDFFIRYAAAYSIAMAFVGTSSNDALKRLYHLAIGDSNEEVRRAACISMGFVLLNEPGKLPDVIKLLSQNFNPHIRYGCALAIGICCSGKRTDAVLNILEPLLADKTDFVRQAALIATSMVYNQACPKLFPKSEKFREDLAKVIANKYEDVLVKFGAVVAQGIIDAGGRNMRISLSDPLSNNCLNVSGIAGMMIFSHFWNWHPFIPFASLAFKPSAFIGVTQDMALPKDGVYLECNNSTSLFAYKEPLKVAEESEKEALFTAVLSTTHKAMARAKKLGKQATPLLTEEKLIQPKEMEIDSSNERKPDTVPIKFTVPNMTRVSEEQRSFISFPSVSVEARYTSVKKQFDYGICVFKDSRPEETFEPIQFVSKYNLQEEALPPQTFELSQ